MSIQRTAAAGRILARAPFLARLSRLRLAAGSQEAGHEAVDLFGSGAFANLTDLELSDPGISVRELEALASALPPRLRTLALRNIGPSISRVLLPLLTVRIPTLHKLDLSQNSITPFPAHSLAGALFLESVEDLDLSASSGLAMEGTGLAWRNRRTSASGCANSNLNRNLLGPAGCRWLAAGSFPSLRSLHLRTNQIGDEGLRSLARSPELSGLKALHVSYNGITSLGALGLAEAFPPWLEVLESELRIGIGLIPA